MKTEWSGRLSLSHFSSSGFSIKLIFLNFGAANVSRIQRKIREPEFQSKSPKYSGIRSAF